MLKAFTNIILISLCFFFSANSYALQYVNVEYSKIKFEEIWTYNFTVTNNVGVENLDIYFLNFIFRNHQNYTSVDYSFDLPSNNWTGSISLDDDSTKLSYFNVMHIGVQNTETFIPEYISHGHPLSGFILHTPFELLDIIFLAYLYDYKNEDTENRANFEGNYNPVFGKTASHLQSNNLVPEPSTLLLICIGLIGLARYGRRSELRTS